MSNCTRIAFYHFPPSMVLRNGEYKGISLEVLQIILHSMKQCIEYVHAKNGFFGVRKENGSFAGPIGLIQRQEADIVGLYLAYDIERWSVAEFAPAFLIMDNAGIYRRPTLEPNKWGFLEFVNHQFWVYLMFSFVAIQTITWLITRLFRVEKMYSMDFLGIFLERGLPPRMISTKSKYVVVVVWLLTAFLLSNFYKATLQAALIIPKMEIPFETFEEMVQQNEYQWTFHAGILLETRTRLAAVEDSQSLLGKIGGNAIEESWPRSKIMPGLFTHKMVAIAPRKFAELNMARDFGQKKVCRYAVLSRGVFAGPFSYAMSKEYGHKKEFSKRIQMFVESGLYELILKRFSPHMRECTGSPKSDIEYKARPYTLRDVEGIIFVYLVGIGLSLITFIMEHVWHK